MSLKEKICRNEQTFGSWITLGSPEIAEILLQAGFDWLTVDMEHSAISRPQAQHLIQVIALGGGVPLVRVGENHSLLIKRVMDAGAHGVIVPMVNTKEDAERAVRAVRYPPEGNRGVGLGRAQGYGFSFEDYKNWLERESIVIAQIEHIEAIANLESILQVDGIDGTIIGPYDLSGSIGFPGEFDRPEIKEAIARYKAVHKKFRKTMGFHVIPADAQAAREKKDEGYRFLAWSLDTLFLGSACREGLKSLKVKTSKVP